MTLWLTGGLLFAGLSVTLLVKGLKALLHVNDTAYRPAALFVNESDTVHALDNFGKVTPHAKVPGLHLVTIERVGEDIIVTGYRSVDGMGHEVYRLDAAGPIPLIPADFPRVHIRAAAVSGGTLAIASLDTLYLVDIESGEIKTLPPRDVRAILAGTDGFFIHDRGNGLQFVHTDTANTIEPVTASVSRLIAVENGSIIFLDATGAATFARPGKGGWELAFFPCASELMTDLIAVDGVAWAIGPTTDIPYGHTWTRCDTGATAFTRGYNISDAIPR